MARQEEAERRFNRPEFGKKDKVFPLAEGELARERQAAPMHRRGRAFIKDQDEEMPEIKQRGARCQRQIFANQCLHICYHQKVSNIFTQRLLYTEIFGFWVRHSRL